MTIRNGLPPIHPREFLGEALEESDTSQAGFARVRFPSPRKRGEGQGEGQGEGRRQQWSLLCRRPAI